MVMLQTVFAKNSSLQMKLILILAGMYTSQIVAFGAHKALTHALKSRCTQNKFGADFDPEALLGHFSAKMNKERPLQSMATVIGPC